MIIKKPRFGPNELVLKSMFFFVIFSNTLIIFLNLLFLGKPNESMIISDIQRTFPQGSNYIRLLI